MMTNIYLTRTNINRIVLLVPFSRCRNAGVHWDVRSGWIGGERWREEVYCYSRRLKNVCREEGDELEDVGSVVCNYVMVYCYI